jgi:hypothetical protein
MSTLVLQVIIKQWDKGQRTAEHVAQRAKIPEQYPINFPPAYYVFDNQCVIDQHGDDLLGDRVSYLQADDGKIKFDRFQVCLNSKLLDYIDKADSDKESETIGSLDNNWIQCKYDWRYSVYEGGFYYWLYEEVCINVICIDTFDENVFLNTKPAVEFTR